MFEALETITARPVVFSVYTAAELWTNEHTAKQMLAYHLNDDGDEFDVEAHEFAIVAC